MTNARTENFPSPLQIIEFLKSKQMQNLANRINNLDLKYKIPSSEFVRYKPQFDSSPTVIDMKTN